MARDPAPDSTPLKPADPEEAKQTPVTREEIAMLAKPRSQIAEQLRSLRNSLTALNPSGAPRTVVVASAARGEGKTVVALNLAVALVEVPRTQVLVVDADLHGPSVERYLGLPRRQGLTELLRGECSPDVAIRQTSIPGVSIVGAGTLPPNPSKLLGSERMKSVLGLFKQRFSWILIDTPQALTINDASLLGASADGILLVARLGKTPRHQVEQVTTQLESLGGNVLGTCLTGALIPDTATNY